MSDEQHNKGGKKSYTRPNTKDFRGDRKPSSGFKKPYGERGEKRHFDSKDGEHRPFGEKKSFGDRPQGERRPFGDRPQGERRSFGDRPQGERRPFGDRPQGERRSFGDRPQGERRPFGDRPQGERRPFGDRPQGERRPFGDRPRGDRKPFGDRPRGDRPFPAKREERRPVSDGMPSRRIALDVIRAVTEKGAYASLALDERLKNCGLTVQDRRLVSRLVYETLEHLIYLDYVLKQVMSRPDTDIKLLNVLRMGACQLLLLDRIPESAVTNTSVNLCKEVFKAAGCDETSVTSMAGVCNGILRNLIRKKDEIVFPDPAGQPVLARSIRYSVPEWLVEKLTADWGEEAADALMACRAQEAVTVRPNLTRVANDEFETLLHRKVWNIEKGVLAHSWHVTGAADIGEDSDFSEGNFSIQGESSMMACYALAPKRGMQVLDACAAPGGKACFIGELMDGTGRVQAWELHPHRTKLIEAQAHRLGLENIRPITRDASKPLEDAVQSMDAVLLDAPCSGLGTMADKPDVKLRVTAESVSELCDLQGELLENVSSMVKPGGVLVYSTCSVLKCENEYRVEKFLARHPEFTLEKLPATIPEQFRQYEGTGLQLLPSRDGVGGFYMARMRRARL